MRHLVALLIFAGPLGASDPVETPTEVKQRHKRVAERRGGTDIFATGARLSSPRRTLWRRSGPRSSWAGTATRSTSGPPKMACSSAFTTTCSTGT